jgi:hypothetical protein
MLACQSLLEAQRRDTALRRQFSDASDGILFVFCDHRHNHHK